MVNVREISALIYNDILSKKDNLIRDWNNPKQTNTKHLVIDNLLPHELCMKIYNSFPKDLSDFYQRSSFREKKKTSALMNLYDEIISNCLYAFQEKNVLNIISEITNTSDLEADEKLYAGGISAMSKGDYLNPHIDNSHDIKRQKYRRLNLLYYVTPKWELKNGGNFELWDENIKFSKTIVSNFNRLVIMETTRKSWHSVNKVVTNNMRYCISNYYFSKKPPTNIKENYFHVTSFTGRPGEFFKRGYGQFDNMLRNIVSKSFKLGRGKKLINKKNKS